MLSATDFTAPLEVDVNVTGAGALLVQEECLNVLCTHIKSYLLTSVTAKINK